MTTERDPIAAALIDRTGITDVNLFRRVAVAVVMAVAGLFLAVDCGRAAGSNRAASGGRSPNIVFVFADDLGWTDLGCYGSRYYETPNIDRLRRQGMKFTDAYTNAPNCAPTRACLMSGQYGPRHGIYTVSTGARGLEKFRKMIPVKNQTRLPLRIVTLADALKSAGYVTGHFGKWHLGHGPAYHPSQRGFDTAFVRGGRHHIAPRFKMIPPLSIKPGTYLADFLTDLALGFIRDNQDKPFFLYLPHAAVHTPIEALESDSAKYRNKKPVGGHHNPVYAGMITSVDRSVGRIMKLLDELKLSDNTLFVFYSDNGGVGGYGDLGGSTGRNITNNAPLRGGKGMLYEGGVRVPLIIRWPGVVKANSLCSEPVITIDFYPTFLEIAGRRSRPKQILDGESFVPLLKSAGKAKLQRKTLYWHFPGYLEANVRKGTWRTTPAGAIRRGNYKLIEFFEDQHVELYDLQHDLSQKHDLSRRLPEKTAQLRRRLHDWRTAVHAPMPIPKKPVAGP